jgi:PGF-CTERM protein
MELPVTGKAPHELVHVLIEDPDVTAKPEAKSAADAIHNALHAFDDASKAMRLNLEDLEYTIATAAAATPAAATPTPKGPGFEAIFAIAGILAVAHLVLRRTR